MRGNRDTINLGDNNYIFISMCGLKHLALYVEIREKKFCTFIVHF